jgi:hypothetical protein
MRNRHITRFGSPLARSGALYFATDLEGLIQMEVDMKLAQLQLNGIVITPEVRSQVKGNARQKRAEYHDKVGQLGIPDKLKDLFLITRKAQAEQYSRGLVISEYDLFLLIHNCNQIRFTHRSKFKQYVPGHLKVTDTDRAEMMAGNPQSMRKKVKSGLLERRYIHVHLFEYGSDWHCFYFSHQDIDPTDTNHWAYGCHLHYVSHLWPNFKKRHIWNKFNKRFTEIPGTLHIKFKPFEWPKPDEFAKSYLNKESELPPWAVIFNPSLAGGCGSTPLPVAAIATRGLWVTEVYPPYRSNQ